MGVENFYGPLMSGDMNGDGVQEIYACDTTATTIRYILTEKGLKTANEDIQYGQCIYPCDFDGNAGRTTGSLRIMRTEGDSSIWLRRNKNDGIREIYDRSTGGGGEALAAGEVPIGAVMVRNGEIIARGITCAIPTKILCATRRLM